MINPQEKKMQVARWRGEKKYLQTKRADNINMYKVQYMYVDEREMRCQTRQSIDSAEERRLSLYILLSRKGVHCTFWKAEQVAQYEFYKSGTYGGESLGS